MIDYTLSFPDEATREAVFPTPDGAPASWYSGGRAIMPIRVIRTDAVYSANGSVVTPEEVAPGDWIVVRCAAPDATMAAFPALIIATDSDLAAAGQPFILYKHPDVTWEQLQARISPVWAGDAYPFGPSVGEDDLVA